MQIPSYWAEARRQRREGGRQVTVRRFGWSDESQAEAEALAAERAEVALQAAWSDEQLPSREPKVPYNGAEGVPIREEVLERHGAVVLTRNSYGAVCLNSPDLLIADIDGEIHGLRRLLPGAGILLALPMLLLVGRIVDAPNWLWTFSMFTVIVAPLAAAVMVAIWQADPVRRLRTARERLQRFLAKHPAWLVRLYTTPAGLRLIAVHRPFEPRSAEVAWFFKNMSVDPLYARMCKHQDCFRARLSAKPWRIGLKQHLKPRPGVWPVAPEHLPARRAWLAEYERSAANFAACRFEAELGQGRPDPTLSAQIALHDQRSRALSSLPQA